MLELSQNRTMAGAPGRYGAQVQQPRKLMLALVLLLVALVAILIRDRQFWFGSEEAVIESDVPATQPAAVPSPAVTSSSPSAPAVATKKPVAPAQTSSQPTATEAPAVTATRTVLPPLDVEVVAGESHRSVRPPSNVTKVQVSKTPQITPEAPAASITNQAAEHAPIAAAPARTTQTEIHATYPVLAQHMNVQGSVVLEAVIATDGSVENVRVLHGPAILANAAQQAVREWRFKPIYQNGQAVESKANITVNFTIKVGDSIPGSTLAQSTTSDGLIISR